MLTGQDFDCKLLIHQSMVAGKYDTHAAFPAQRLQFVSVVDQLPAGESVTRAVAGRERCVVSLAACLVILISVTDVGQMILSALALHG